MQGGAAPRSLVALSDPPGQCARLAPCPEMPQLLDLANLPDADVVALAQQGREAAYRELIRRYERPVFSLISFSVCRRSLSPSSNRLAPCCSWRSESRRSRWVSKSVFVSGVRIQ